MSKVFDAYARYYDLLYQDKDYSAEAEYVAAHIRKQMPKAQRILDLGCGTGAHAEHLAKMGFDVHGVDLSEPMLERAKKRKNSLPPEVAARLTFSQGDIRTIRIGQTYDAVISLFHVMSYQTTNEDLEAAFATAAFHLRTGGVFLFDFWYGPAVLRQLPEIRVKRLEDTFVRVIRIAEPIIKPNENLTVVNYDIWVEDKSSGGLDRVQEKHIMRYLFLPELHFFLYNKGIRDCKVYEWLTGNDLTIQSWNGFIISSKFNIE